METNLPQIILKPNREKSILKHHLWIFSGAIEGVTRELSDGEIVDIYSNSGKYLATGHFQNGSIAVRIFSFNKVNPDKTFWKSLISNAIEKRKAMQLFSFNITNAFRLIHGESDMMPGLIADYYNKIIVIQAHSIGMFKLLPLISECFVELLNDNITAIYSKSGMTIKTSATDEQKDCFLYGNVPSAEIIENGMKFNVDFINGQKTGFFIDQRNNRKLLADCCKGKTVLNVFGYTGAFSVAALKGHAKHVTTVDISENAIEMTKHNIELNFGQCDNHTEVVSDVFDFFANNKEQYDIIILDPPAFAKHIDVKDHAMKAYRRLNTLGLKQLTKHGILFTFSCSQVIQKNDFLTILYNASNDTEKKVSILYQLHQSEDHCINIYHPETEYLKGMAVMVD